LKLKKTHLFFICYYALAIIGTALAAVLLWDKRSLSVYSLIPCLVILGLVLYACCDPLRRITHDLRFKSFAITVWMLCVPLPLPFILFFHNMAKGLSCRVIFLGIIVIRCYSDFKIRKESEKQQKESQKERKRQEQLESQGKWKE